MSAAPKHHISTPLSTWLIAQKFSMMFMNNHKRQSLFCFIYIYIHTHTHTHMQATSRKQPSCHLWRLKNFYWWLISHSAFGSRLFLIPAQFHSVAFGTDEGAKQCEMCYNGVVSYTHLTEVNSTIHCLSPFQKVNNAVDSSATRCPSFTPVAAPPGSTSLPAYPHVYGFPSLFFHVFLCSMTNNNGFWIYWHGW
jgi:hypothetical protein